MRPSMAAIMSSYRSVPKVYVVTSPSPTGTDARLARSGRTRRGACPGVGRSRPASSRSRSGTAPPRSPSTTGAPAASQRSTVGDADRESTLAKLPTPAAPSGPDGATEGSRMAGSRGMRDFTGNRRAPWRLDVVAHPARQPAALPRPCTAGGCTSCCPRTHSEWIHHYKFLRRDAWLPRLTDKIEAKRFIAETGRRGVRHPDVLVRPDAAAPARCAGSGRARTSSRPPTAATRTSRSPPRAGCRGQRIERKTERWLRSTYGRHGAASGSTRGFRPRLIVEQRIGEPGGPSRRLQVLGLPGPRPLRALVHRPRPAVVRRADRGPRLERAVPVGLPADPRALPPTTGVAADDDVARGDPRRGLPTSSGSTSTRSTDVPTSASSPSRRPPASTRSTRTGSTSISGGSGVRRAASASRPRRLRWRRLRRPRRPPTRSSPGRAEGWPRLVVGGEYSLADASSARRDIPARRPGPISMAGGGDLRYVAHVRRILCTPRFPFRCGSPRR